MVEWERLLGNTCQRWGDHDWAGENLNHHVNAIEASANSVRSAVLARSSEFSGPETRVPGFSVTLSASHHWKGAVPGKGTWTWMKCFFLAEGNFSDSTANTCSSWKVESCNLDGTLDRHWKVWNQFGTHLLFHRKSLGDEWLKSQWRNENWGNWWGGVVIIIMFKISNKAEGGKRSYNLNMSSSVTRRSIVFCQKEGVQMA